MKYISLALASVGLVGVGFASALVIYDHFGGADVTAQQGPDQQLVAQSSSASTSQPEVISNDVSTISIDAEMAYSMATFCHSYVNGNVLNGDYVYTRKSDSQFSPIEVEISLTGTCRNFIAAFENQVRNQSSEQVHYDEIRTRN
jgi:hypothetical protein